MTDRERCLAEIARCEGVACPGAALGWLDWSAELLEIERGERMTNQERAERVLTKCFPNWVWVNDSRERLGEVMVTYGIECANAELERRRAAEAERDAALAQVAKLEAFKRAVLEERHELR